MPSCGEKKTGMAKAAHAQKAPASCCALSAKGDMHAGGCPLSWFEQMVQHCYDYATEAKGQGRKVVGIMCEYTPREILMAAGAVPVCLCGGSAEMIPPAEELLPTNLCPLIKSTFGYSLRGANPFLEMADILVGETTCDGKKKMYEILGGTRPLHVLELPQKPEDPFAAKHWYHEIVRLKEEVERRCDADVTDDALRGSIAQMNRERRLRRELAALMTSDSPPLTGRELLDFKSLISCLPEDLLQYERALEMLPGRTLTPPARERVRVLLTGVPLPHGAERVMDIIEKNGGLVVCQENCTGIKPLIDDVDEDGDDPLRAIAEKYFHLPCSVMTDNGARLDLLRRLVEEYRPHCIIELTWQACITYDVESYFVRKIAAEDLDLPYLRIETDYSPSDSARIAMRVEALFEMVRGARREP